VRLVTVNLYNGRVVPDDLRRFLDEFEPEILCAQEVGHAAALLLESYFDHGTIEPATDFRGKAMVARLPIDPRPFDLAWRGGYRATVDLAGTPIDLVSAHLANPIDRGTGVSVRRRQVTALRPVLEELSRGVFVGDMNATPLWPAYQRIRRWMEDGIGEWAKRSGERPPRTWGPYPDWPALLRIDHVFTKGVEVTHVQAERIAGLDHRAVVVDLVVAGAQS